MRIVALNGNPTDHLHSKLCEDEIIICMSFSTWYLSDPKIQNPALEQSTDDPSMSFLLTLFFACFHPVFFKVFLKATCTMYVLFGSL